MPRANYMQSIESRLVERLKVNDQTGCWEYQGFTPPPVRHGCQYPLMGVSVPGRERKLALAHRVAAWLWLGLPLDPPPYVLHDCDNKICCCPNPGHIREGTISENVRDAYARGLQPTKLTRAEVEKIRRLYATGRFTQARIGKAAGVSQEQIGNIVRGKSWK